MFRKIFEKRIFFKKASNLCISLLHRVSGDKSVDHDLVRLTYPVGPTEGLDVVVRVPVRVIDDDGVSCGQINTQASCPGG